jgi:hypothetical protein
MTGNIKVVPNDKLAQAKAAAEEERKRIADENYKLGVRVGEGHKAWAYGLAGVIVGAVLMGLYTMATSERAMFNAGAVADRVLGRVVEPAQLAAPEVDPFAYERNAQIAREQACSEGVRDPRSGRCPSPPGTVDPNSRR